LTACISQSQSELQRLEEDADSARRLIEGREQRRIQSSSEIRLLDQEKASMRIQMDDVCQQLEISRVELADAKQRVAIDYERAMMEIRARSAHSASD